MISKWKTIRRLITEMDARDDKRLHAMASLDLQETARVSPINGGKHLHSDPAIMLVSAVAAYIKGIEKEYGDVGLVSPFFVETFYDDTVDFAIKLEMEERLDFGDLTANLTGVGAGLMKSGIANLEGSKDPVCPSMDDILDKFNKWAWSIGFVVRTRVFGEYPDGTKIYHATLFYGDSAVWRTKKHWSLRVVALGEGGSADGATYALALNLSEHIATCSEEDMTDVTVPKFSYAQ